MTKDEALDKALYALEIEDSACRYMKDETPSQIVEAITAIKQARSAPVQEPQGKLCVFDDADSEFGWSYDISGNAEQHRRLKELDGAMIYTTPPAAQRQWVGLTKDEVLAIGKELGLKCKLGGNPNIDFDYAEAIEAKLKERNT